MQKIQWFKNHKSPIGHSEKISSVKEIKFPSRIRTILTCLEQSLSMLSAALHFVIGSHKGVIDLYLVFFFFFFFLIDRRERERQFIHFVLPGLNRRSWLSSTDTGSFVPWYNVLFKKKNLFCEFLFLSVIFILISVTAVIFPLCGVRKVHYNGIKWINWKVTGDVNYFITCHAYVFRLAVVSIVLK